MSVDRNEPHVLHLLPRCSGGGPERSLIAAITEAPSTPSFRHHIIVLDGPIAPAMYIAARRARATVTANSDLDALRNATASADVVVVHYWNHPRLLATLALLELPPTRVVVWAHVLGLHPPQVLTAELGKYADVLVLTTDVSRCSPGAGVAQHVLTVPGIADMRRLDGFAHRPHSGIEVGYVGVVNDAKMHPRFVEMSNCVKNPDVRFVVYGGGGGEEALRGRIDRLGAADRFTLAGFTDDVRTALETVDIFGYPLCVETYATSEKALQEAMWVGVPPVVFPHGGVADLVHHDETGLVVTTEAEYAAAVDRLAGDATLRERLGSRAREVARRRFRPAELAAAWTAAIHLGAGLPRRERAALHAGRQGAGLFVASLGELAGPFAAASGSRADDRAAAEVDIAQSAPGLVGGEGGIMHYRNTWPDDPLLRRWSGLVARAAGRVDVADAEFRAADTLGARQADAPAQ